MRKLYIRTQGPRRHPMSPTFKKRFRETLKVRHDVPRDMRPLYNHILGLASHSYERGYFKQAGRELAAARKLTKHRGSR